MSRNNRLAVLLSALLLATALPACTPMESMNPGYSHSLKSYNYDAADTLVSRAGRKISKDTPLVVGTIGNVNNVETSSTLGRTITEEVSARLAQNGYSVSELKLRQGISIQNGGFSPEKTGEFLLSRNARDVNGAYKAAAVITGTYAMGAKRILVNLRLIDVRSGKVVTAYDYELPRSVDIDTMVKDNSTEKTEDAFFGGNNW